MRRARRHTPLPLVPPLRPAARAAVCACAHLLQHIELLVGGADRIEGGVAARLDQQHDLLALQLVRVLVRVLGTHLLGEHRHLLARRLVRLHARNLLLAQGARVDALGRERLPALLGHLRQRLQSLEVAEEAAQPGERLAEDADALVVVGRLVDEAQEHLAAIEAEQQQLHVARVHVLDQLVLREHVHLHGLQERHLAQRQRLTELLLELRVAPTEVRRLDRVVETLHLAEVEAERPGRGIRCSSARVHFSAARVVHVVYYIPIFAYLHTCLLHTYLHTTGDPASFCMLRKMAAQSCSRSPDSPMVERPFAYNPLIQCMPPPPGEDAVLCRK
eukprot:5378273-Prymnesium_polylepis.1